jgi:hypothetical protein
MITLDDILNATCEITGADREKVIDKRRIDQTHQIARIVFCHSALGRATYHKIGQKINRDRRNVGYFINNANLYLEIQTAIKEVKEKLNIT